MGGRKLDEDWEIMEKKVKRAMEEIETVCIEIDTV